MGEIIGNIIAYSSDADILNNMYQHYKNNREIQIDRDEYYAHNIQLDNVLVMYVDTGKYSHKEELLEKIYKDYPTDIAISSFSKNAYLDNKTVKKAQALKAISKISDDVAFMLTADEYKDKKAFEILEKGNIDLSKKFFGWHHYERCFLHEYAPMMKYAIERGYHNHIISIMSDKHVLHHIIGSSDLSLVELALEKGADPNARDEDDYTLLHNIAYYATSDEFDFDTIKLINILKSFGADFNAKDYEGLNPLFLFSEESSHKLLRQKDKLTSIVKALINAGTRIDEYDEEGKGLLLHFKKCPDVVRILLELKPDLKTELE